eukprot:gi/632947662/ref/XP_007889162.1/ PREDICTED: putative helicase Mov10l1 isoform X2 [Callorhinchus milii]
MLSLVSKTFGLLWRTVDDSEEDNCEDPDCTEYTNVHKGTVTRFCGDYGLVNDFIYFTPDLVLGGMPLQIGQKVNVIAQKNATSGGWKALKVEPVTREWDEDITSDTYIGLPCRNEPSTLIGSITSCNNYSGYINDTTYFLMADVCDGYKPYKGDWIQAQYFIDQATWKSQACCVKPLRYKRVDKAQITRIFHRSGVVDDDIIFTLDSVRLPNNYLPHKDDWVNLVIIESNQSLYSWRALCMAPMDTKSFSVAPQKANAELEQIDFQLFSSKGGLEVTKTIHFGNLKQGEKKDMILWIENKGEETQHLLRSKLAGWERADQFVLEAPTVIPRPSASANETVQKKIPPEIKSNDKVTEFQPLYVDLSSPGTSGQQCKSPGPVTQLAESNSPVPTKPIQQLSCPLSGGDFSATEAPGIQSIEKYNHGNLASASPLVSLLPNEKAYINIKCEAKNPGCCKELLLLYFSGFVIGRYIEVVVLNDEESLLAPCSTYVPVQLKTSRADPQEANAIIVMGQKPIRLARRHLPSFIPQYPIPQRIKDCIARKADILTAQPKLVQELNMSNYQEHFSTLLWLEEIQAELEIQEFYMVGVVLKKSGDFLILEVPGLAEGRPSVTIGDRLLLRSPGYEETTVCYSGFVAQVCEEEIMLKFHSTFQQTYKGEPLDVEFTYNRTSIRRCHFAVEQAFHLGEAVLFPERVTLQAPQVITTWKDIDLVLRDENENRCNSKGENDQEKDLDSALSSSCKSLEAADQERGHRNAKERATEIVYMSDGISVSTQTGSGAKNITGPSKRQECEFFNSLLNESQKCAVQRILRGECRPTPYILYGPPGTGKTVTIIEAILQIHHTLPHSRILAATPSNSAADLLCVRLHESNMLKQGDLVRVNASCRAEETIPEIVQLYSKGGEDLWEASRHRIIISTCTTAGLFFQIGLRTGHFTHVFVDESGQASEPECLIPLLLVSEKDGQIVIVGDPKQLGPVMRSKIASVYGLPISFLERLMARPVYSRDEGFSAFGSYNPLLVTKLNKNYRSHSSLLKLPSELFYHKDLKMCADQSVVNSFCNWEKLPKKGFPLIFHGLRGAEMREGSNPSWFNPKEAVQVMRYCCLLAKNYTSPVKQSDIGVIAAYHKQVQKIRILLRSGNLSEIKVGSVEEFQGREYLVIIVSTIRSSEDNMSEDARYVLGFLSSPKRFNVAITRAKALLIVVGNPHILIKDPCWSALLEYCVVNNAYVGCDLPQELLAQQR